MFKYFALCFFAIIAMVAAKPGLVAPLAYSAPLVTSAAALPYTAAYTTAYSSPYYTSYASPYIAGSPYTDAYTAAAYSAYPYSSILLRR
ncbi:uncharacterized protein LOC119678763 [Teleopsis dalmanni]|uniref:uncharacterized protein LOC119678763 n=1 Tax=Teleopsis dalmanni TaxID=139649 RepID=UPI0018CE00AA|nr:uncharacterized protein LOC119678763 [Teleopsis dalmanni]